MKTRNLLILIFCLIGLLVINGETGLINMSVATIGKELNISIGANHWIITIYLLCFAANIVAAGKIGAIYGYYKVAFWGLLIFCVGEFLCSTAGSFYPMITGRFFQGFGASFCMPSLIAIVFQIFEGEKGKASGCIEGTIGVAMVVGPFYGSFIMEEFSWNYIFSIDGVIILVLVAMFWYYKKLFKQKKEAESVDILGSVFLFVSIVTLMCALNALADIKNQYIIFIVLVIIHIISDIMFYLRETKIKNPLIRFSLFKEHPMILAGCSIRFMLMGVIYIGTYIVGVLLQGRHLSTMETAVFLLPMSIPMAVLSPISGKLIDKIGVKFPVLIGGFLLILAPLFLYLFQPLDILSFLFIGLLLLGISYAAISTASLSLVIGNVKKELHGMVSGMFYMFSMLAGSLFITIAGAVLDHNKAIITDTKTMLYSSFKQSMIICFVLAIISFIIIVYACKKSTGETD